LDFWVENKPSGNPGGLEGPLVELDENEDSSRKVQQSESNVS
jgi:hypothetical protein